MKVGLRSTSFRGVPSCFPFGEESGSSLSRGKKQGRGDGDKQRAWQVDAGQGALNDGRDEAQRVGVLRDTSQHHAHAQWSCSLRWVGFAVSMPKSAVEWLTNSLREGLRK